MHCINEICRTPLFKNFLYRIVSYILFCIVFIVVSVVVFISSFAFFGFLLYYDCMVSSVGHHEHSMNTHTNTHTSKRKYTTTRIKHHYNSPLHFLHSIDFHLCIAFVLDFGLEHVYSWQVVASEQAVSPS